MFLKAMGDFKTYIYAYDAYGIYVNLFIGSSAVFEGLMELEQRTKGPWDGEIEFIVKKAMNHSTLLNIRLPEWSGKYTVLINGKEVSPELVKGYLVIRHQWQEADVVKVSMEMPINRIEAHPYVTHLKSKVALQKGPFLYCAEGVDNGGSVNIQISGSPELKAEYHEELLDGVSVISGKDINGKNFTVIPYYSWDNRESGQMAVWLEQEGKQGKISMNGWENVLYRKYDVK